VTGRPDSTEAGEYYFRYIDEVHLEPEQDICQFLSAQLDEVLALASIVDDGMAGYRYAAGKWSLRQVLGHVSDTERVFAYRMFWFARGFEGRLPNFDENASVDRAGSEARPWTSLVAEFAAVRRATLTLLQHLPDDAWMRRGVASNNTFTVRAIAFVAAGHVAHHLRLIRARYLAGR
jgi:hypothetical protein